MLLAPIAPHDLGIRRDRWRTEGEWDGDGVLAFVTPYTYTYVIHVISYYYKRPERRPLKRSSRHRTDELIRHNLRLASPIRTSGDHEISTPLIMDTGGRHCLLLYRAAIEEPPVIYLTDPPAPRRTRSRVRRENWGSHSAFTDVYRSHLECISLWFKLFEKRKLVLIAGASVFREGWMD